MKLAEYARHDGLGLAELVAKGEVSASELAKTAARAIEVANPAVNAVVEVYQDRIDKVDEKALGNGPFCGVPLLMKDVFGHEKGRLIEFGSRLCKGMVQEFDTNYAFTLRASGVNIIGRTNAPEYSMAGTTENALYGNTSNPWKAGYSAGGSTGGGMAAVTAGMVPVAHGSDIAGSVRIPASYCGGVGLKPSRGRVSFGPAVDEHGFGMATNFVQVKTVRDAAAMLDCLAVEFTGDPYTIPKPAESYASLAKRAAGPLRVGVSTRAIAGVPTEPEVATAVQATAKTLASMGHEVLEVHADCGGAEALTKFLDLWFFAFDQRLQGYAAKTGQKIGAETLEPVVLTIYEYAKGITPARFMAAVGALNTARRRLAQVYEHCDVWLTPATATVAPPWGKINLGRADVTMDRVFAEILAVPCQFTLPHNIMGTPAISLPVAMSSYGLPIGVQLAARHAGEHVVLQLATALEEAMPWAARVPPLHVSTLG